jgi:DNA glycosylase AlkZ-like
MPRVRTLAEAAAWIDRVGLALLLPKDDAALPSLWERINGSPLRDWAVRAPDGSFVEWTAEMGILWRTKDELPASGGACVGRHLARAVSCIAPRVVPALRAAAGEPELDGHERAIRDVVAEAGPQTAPELRRLLGLEKRVVERTVGSLHRKLVLTHDRLVDRDAGWGTLAHELTERKWPGAAPDDPRAELVRLVLAAAGELTAADVKGVFGWPIREAADVLDRVAESRAGGGFRIWAQP